MSDVYPQLAPAGTLAVLSLVEGFGAAAAVLVTLVRKCSSMLLSYALWPKPLSALHVWCYVGSRLSPLPACCCSRWVLHRSTIPC